MCHTQNQALVVDGQCRFSWFTWCSGVSNSFVLLTQVLDQRSSLQSLYQQLTPYLSQHGINKQQFTWAVTIVRSRTFVAPLLQQPLSTYAKVVAALQVALVAAGLLSSSSMAAAFEVGGLLAVVGAAVAALQQAKGSEQHAMCPLIDMINHNTSEQV